MIHFYGISIASTRTSHGFQRRPGSQFITASRRIANSEWSANHKMWYSKWQWCEWARQRPPQLQRVNHHASLRALHFFPFSFPFAWNFTTVTCPNNVSRTCTAFKDDSHSDYDAPVSVAD